MNDHGRESAEDQGDGLRTPRGKMWPGEVSGTIQ